MPLFTLSTYLQRKAKRKLHELIKGPAAKIVLRNKPHFELMQPVQEFPILGIKLPYPLHNCYLKSLGKVDSLEKMQLSFHRKINVYPRPTRKELSKNKSGAHGHCNYALYSPERYCVTAYCTSGIMTTDTFVQAHEEMHAIQMFKRREAYELIKEKFRRNGFHVRLDIFSMEEQANLAGMLIAIERHGKEVIEVLCDSSSQISPPARNAITFLASESRNGFVTKLWDRIFPDKFIPYDYMHRLCK